MGSQEEPEDHSAVPQLAADCDLASLPLSPAEGYLLSRVDGRTPWRLLREAGGLSPDEADRCLRRLVAEGVVQLDPGKPELPAAIAVPEDLEALLDPTLELPLESQRAVLAFSQGLDRPYHEVLGVPADADGRALRRAYFKLSKEFHPDRYFRKNLGPFAECIERIFCKIAEAYELLSDPSARAEMEKSLQGAAGAAPGGPAAPRLRGRTTPHAFSLVARIDRERRRKAGQYFELGSQALAAESFLEAAQHLRLAIACDPRNEAYKEPFGEANRRANEIHAERYMKEADSHYQLGEFGEAYRRYVDALHCRPFDAEANHRAAKLAWRIEHDLKAAKEYAARACEVAPDEPAYHKTLGEIYAEAELYKNAQREFEHVLRLTPDDAATKQELKSIKRLARAPRGGS